MDKSVSRCLNVNEISCHRDLHAPLMATHGIAVLVWSAWLGMTKHLRLFDKRLSSKATLFLSLLDFTENQTHIPGILSQ